MVKFVYDHHTIISDVKIVILAMDKLKERYWFPAIGKIDKILYPSRLGQIKISNFEIFGLQYLQQTRVNNWKQNQSEEVIIFVYKTS